MERSSDKIELELTKAILAGDYPVGSTLPPERVLAKKFGVGRPTVREALQRLKGGGWITVRKGHSAIVNDYWYEGNLATLVNIVQNYDSVTGDFITYLLELRKALTPAYIRDAVECNRPKVIALLSNLEQLKDDTECYAVFDWDLQKSLAKLSSNPLYLLILNNFNDLYIKMARKYFSGEQNRKLALEYYNQLLTTVMDGSPTEAEEISKKTMEKSLVLWRNREEK